ncbi:protein-L-isoaspartate(D-aspartate) O-methyltransferase [Sphingomonas sp. BN140010]|uniref:Protein-L-isoaspartate O-methyltransferase n=1 Tax=Sphingomonas arvum TaxID=2992113 RepID=A0ABT3JGV3_9SPHN|nr:protein-L-isoaspartate(D-aspartate) O-methyltransferase [Sphingomonas sp. BN140010]MCW3798226.1 protein-L-isoaspartate(D-aspartate) O-methyltransferase [Sphingomonas sp. BN140010]
MTDFRDLCERMIQRDLVRRGINDPRLLRAFVAVPRELFVSPELKSRAYDDRPLPIAAGQTISQPFIVARMIELAGLSEHDHVLEVGAGSGYAAAIMAQLARSVVAIERHGELAAQAQDRVQRLRLRNLRIVHGDGTRGWPPDAPYDAILCAAAGLAVPPAWWEQLAPGGQIVMPLGPAGGEQVLTVLTTSGQQELDPVRFVPLIDGPAD